MDTRPIVGRLRAAGCVFAEEEAALLAAAATSPTGLDRLVTRRVGGTPLEQILGWAEFCGLRIPLAPGVFVPRRRTELLVRLAAAHARPGAVVVDLGCGSAAVALAVAARAPHVELHAADIDPAAVAVARTNLCAAGGHVHLGDLFEALPGRLRGRVDVLAVNAPYVPTVAIALMPPEARDHEPAVALDGGPDGLAVHRRVAAGVSQWLAPGGVVAIETGRRQAVATARLLAAQGLRTAIETDDELEATVVTGSLPSRHRTPVISRSVDTPDPARLANVELFEDLSDEERAVLASWLEVESIAGDRPMLRTDSSGYAFFVLIEGRARAELDGTVLEVLEPGSVFGEMAFFAPDGHRTATIVPETPLRVYSLFGTRFRQMQVELPAVAAKLEKLVHERAARVQAARQQN